jgi:hypothetical protein
MPSPGHLGRSARPAEGDRPTERAVSAATARIHPRGRTAGHIRVLAAWERVAGVLANKAALDPIAQAAAIVGVTGAARTEVKAALDQLKNLNRIQHSLEHESLCASACKRMAMIEHIAGDREATESQVREMSRHYQWAEVLGRRNNDTNWFYPALNRVVADVVARIRDPDQPPLDGAATEELRRCIEMRIHSDPDFQSVVGRVELRLYCALGNERLATELVSILEQFDDLYLRAKAPRFWSSVRDQLDFFLLLCKDSLAPTEVDASEQLMQRLLEISPRARLSKAGGVVPRLPAPRPGAKAKRSATVP